MRSKLISAMHSGVIHNMGKPRLGPSCEAMRRSHLSFKCAIRQWKLQEECVMSYVMAKTSS